MKHGERKAKPGRSRREKDLQRSPLHNLSFNLTFKDHYRRTCPFPTSHLVIRVKSADTRKIESAAARAISSWNRQKFVFLKGKKTRTNCSGKVCEIESGFWQRWIGWRGWRMIICKSPIPPCDHLQEAGSSGWSIARGRALWMMICKGPARCQIVLQSFGRGWLLWMINCKRPDPPADHLQEAGSFG